jgi:hypothetical protein
MKVCSLTKVPIILLVIVIGLSLSAALLVLVRSSAAAVPVYPDDCVTSVVEGTSGFITKTWEAAPSGSACLILQFQEPPGIFNITGGWVFTSPLRVNGTVISTTVVPGQMAPQINPVSFEVITDTELIVEPSWNPPGTEIGFWWNYTENQPPIVTYKTFLPLVNKPTEILKQEFDLYESPDLQVKIAAWPGAASGQEACMIVNFEGTSAQALIESGWFFGSSITRSELNGLPIVLNTLPPPPGEEAKQISSLLLNNNPQKLLVCIVGTDPGLEIGIRFRYPSP